MKWKIVIDEKDLSHELTACPFCGSEEIFRKRDPVFFTPKIFLMSCRHCFCCFTSRMPNKKFLENFYKKYYLGVEREVCIQPDKLARHIFSRLFSLYEYQNISILDFGGSDGSIAYKLAEQILRRQKIKIEIFIADPNSKNLVSENPWITLYTCKYLNDVPNTKTFEIVIASGILEHITNPTQCLRILFNKMQEGGVFYARTPFMVPLFNALNKIGIQIDMLFPEHLFDMGPKFWSRVLTTLNCQEKLKLFISRPSLVETTFKENFFKTCVAYILKIPGYIFKNIYPFSGGWEVFIKKIP